ncbi:MAG: Stp1/IreP family PP2C-type Ser/Thr phosphatase [Anaerolineae bacterium]|nr:Stp1/IreP family PP2C-type Ser/Thr phosphatase [Anaerolineae bacterium]
MSNRLIHAAMHTDVGQIRDHNEDYILRREPANESDIAQNGWLYIVADGVGGADAGEVASQFASQQTLNHYLRNSSQESWGQRLVDSMQAANTDLRRMVAERNDNSRMATTMVAAVIDQHKAYIANVGDSRAYLWRNGTLDQITKDQSLVAKLLEEGAITEAEAENHPRRNVILYSLGSERSPKIDLFERFLEPEDKILLCSDGLTRHVSDDELCQYLASDNIEETSNSLITLANNRGGQDNITIGILHFLGETPLQNSKINGSSQQKTMIGKTAVPAAAAQSSKSLWRLTLLLTVVQTFLIVFLWAMLFA